VRLSTSGIAGLKNVGELAKMLDAQTANRAKV